MEPIEYLKILRRRWLIVVGAGLLAVLVAWVFTPGEPSSPDRRYEATHTLVSTESQNRGVTQTAFLVTTGEVPRRVAEELGLPPSRGPALARAVVSEPDTSVSAVKITAASRDRDRAVLLADTFAEQLLSYLDDQNRGRHERDVESASRRMESLRAQVEELDRRLATGPGLGADVLRAERDALVRQFGLAYERYQQLAGTSAPTAPFTSLEHAAAVLVEDAGFQAPTSRVARVVIGLLVGLALGLGIALLLERFDTRLWTKRQAEEAFGVPVVAEIPRLSGRELARSPLVVSDLPSSQAAEGYRALRTVLVLTGRRASASGEGDGRGQSGPRVILVTSADTGEGKSTTAANLATALAEAGREVLLLDIDAYYPTVHDLLHVVPRPGVADLDTSKDLRRQLHALAQVSRAPGVRVVPSGARGDERRDTSGLAAVVEAARPLADVVVIDSPPLLATSDASQLIPLVDAVVLTARSGGTTVEVATRAAELLVRLEAPVAGLVLVGATGVPATQRYHSRTRGWSPRSLVTRARPGRHGGDGAEAGAVEDHEHDVEVGVEVGVDLEVSAPGDSANRADTPDDGVPGDGVPRDGVPRDGVPRDGADGVGVPRDGVPRDGVLRDGADGVGVPRDGVPRDGVPRDGVPRDGVPRDGVPRDGVPRDGRRERPVADVAPPDVGTDRSPDTTHEPDLLDDTDPVVEPNPVREPRPRHGPEPVREPEPRHGPDPMREPELRPSPAIDASGVPSPAPATPGVTDERSPVVEQSMLRRPWDPPVAPPVAEDREPDPEVDLWAEIARERESLRSGLGNGSGPDHGAGRS